MQSDEFSLKGVLSFLAILVVTMLLVYASITGFYHRLEHKAQQTDARLLQQGSSKTAEADRPYFPGPREQPEPVLDLKVWRAQEEAKLHSYGWINSTAGVVHIPIERAIELLTPVPKKDHP